MREHESNIPEHEVAMPNLPEPEISKLRSENTDLVPGGIPKDNSFFPTGDTTRVAPARTLGENSVVKGYQIARRLSE